MFSIFAIGAVASAGTVGPVNDVIVSNVNTDEMVAFQKSMPNVAMNDAGSIAGECIVAAVGIDQPFITANAGDEAIQSRIANSNEYLNVPNDFGSNTGPSLNSQGIPEKMTMADNKDAYYIKI